MPAAAHTPALTEAEFDQKVNHDAGVALIDFWATWCPPCRAIAPTIDALAEQFAGRALIGKVDVDQERDLAGRFSITSIPTLILFRDGREVARFVGVRSQAELSAAIEGALGVAA